MYLLLLKPYVNIKKWISLFVSFILMMFPQNEIDFGCVCSLDRQINFYVCFGFVTTFDVLRTILQFCLCYIPFILKYINP